MAITLYEATVPNFLQVLGGIRGVLDKGLAHAQATGVEPDSLLEWRLAEDMFPLFRQVLLTAKHSAGALANVRDGAFSFPQFDAVGYAGLQKAIADAEAELCGWTPEAVNALEGKEVLFEVPSARRVFSAEAFLFSFSTPNFYFHGVTAYDILRAKGVPVGKMDYLAGIRTAL
ncbi:DUF1993 domain-containing protein [Phenylobacterium sp. LjRoot219]|uniref:DUF1993 domain-containing protein n=1 Tax=Phenylobacterium sp. LjRoot219 TaxID=3342283 RepID=UPI003ECD35BB